MAMSDAEPLTETDLAIESIVVKTRWFGIVAGVLLVETRIDLRDPAMLRAFLALGAGFAVLDAAHHWRGEVFLRSRPLFVSFMEALFIGLLCYYDAGLESPFRYYYLLSLICCAFRYRRRFVWLTLGFDCLSLAVLGWVLRDDRAGLAALPLTAVILAWVTWASSSLASLLKRAGSRLLELNGDLTRNRAELEQRVAERSDALRASQARVIHQEKMAALGLLAAGIAHEIGNPLTGISSLIQILQRHGGDSYTAEKLGLILNQVGRIQRTIRELVDFSRPASALEVSVRLSDVVDEALGIAKYYQRTKDRAIATRIPADLPKVRAVRDRLSQVVFNLAMNAIDATAKNGEIHLEAELDGSNLALRVRDDGRGVADADLDKLFQPYYTTKPQGTGLGLFVSRQIIEEMGGTLTYRSQADQGAEFVIVLPKERLETAAAPQSSASFPRSADFLHETNR